MAKAPVKIDLLEKELRDLIVTSLGVEEGDVTLNASLEDDLGADSLDRTELVMDIENQYRIDIDDDDIDRLTTVGDVLKYMREQGAKAKSV